MNLRQLHYFVRIADSGSFSAAANELHVAQSALSRHMKELEIELGGVLFDRGRHGVVLSDSGRLLYERARFILVQLEATRNEVMAHNQELVGAVSVMMPSTIGQLLFAPLLRSFLAQFPRVRLKLSEGLWNSAVHGLQNGELDLAIVTAPRTSDYIAFAPLAYEQMILVAPAGDPLLGATSIAVDALAGLPLLMPEATLAAIRCCAPRMADRLDVKIFVESAPPIRALVEAGHGYAVVPRSALLGQLEPRNIAGVPITGFEVLRQIGTLRGRPQSRAMQELAAAIQHAFSGYIAAGLMRAPDGG